MRLALSIRRLLALVSLSLCLILLLGLARKQRSSTAVFDEVLKSYIEHGENVNFQDLQTQHHLIASTQSLKYSTNRYLSSLLNCAYKPSPVTKHVRLPYQYLNISFTPADTPPNPDLHLFNPTILPLPSWSTEAKYLLVSRVVTEGLHQESLICFANFCAPQNSNSTHILPSDTHQYTASDLSQLGPSGGLRCTSSPLKVNIPPTPALSCTGAWYAFPDIPGFHDPRIFWSNKGEPLIIVNSASQYGCVGLWMVDLRTLNPELRSIVNQKGLGPTTSYPHLTELTINPRSARSEVEKNWMLWFPGDSGEAYVQYNMMSHFEQPNCSMNSTNKTASATGGRTFAKLIGNGFTTTNLTHPREQPCFRSSSLIDPLGHSGHWHQSTNALKLILCTRHEARRGLCGEPEKWNENGREVHFAIVQRKFSDDTDLKLPLRYERWVVVWEGKAPSRMIAVSRWPVLFEGESARPWSAEENFGGGGEGWNSTRRGVRNMDREVGFAYTVGLSWAWRGKTDVEVDREEVWEGEEADIHELGNLGRGFLGDEVLMGVGLDDKEQVVVKVQVDELVSCLRLCPGIADLREETDRATPADANSVAEERGGGPHEEERVAGVEKEGWIDRLRMRVE